MTDKVRCAECKWNYPELLLHSMFMDGTYTKPICGICALEVTNKLHGIKVTKFQGEMAERARLDAIAWRKTHLGDKPNGKSKHRF
jgi:hypothetical protein